MAVVVTDLRTIINECDATTGWTGTATPTLFTTEPTGVEATGCLGMTVSATTANAYVTVTAVNFTATPQLIYVWIFHRAELDSRANGGLMIQLGDGTNRIGFHVGGNDVDGFRPSTGPVGWQCLVIDTANLPATFTTFAGARASLNLGAITQIGVGFKTLVKAVGGVANCFWDILRRGAAGVGLLVTGGTVGDPGTWQQIADTDKLTTNQRAHGIVRELGAGVYGVQGSITFGSDTTGATYFSDQNVSIIFEERSVTNDKYIFRVQGNATNNTFFKMASSTIQAPVNGSAQLIASSTNLQNFELVDSQIVRFKNGVTFSSDATNGVNHVISGSTFRNCAQVNTGRVPVRSSFFLGYTPTTAAALLWSSVINIEECQFDNNTRAIEHPSTGTFTYTGLRFSTNTYDILNSSTGLVTINASAGSNPATFLETVVDSTVINNTKNFTFAVEDSAGNPLTNYEWRLYEEDPADGIIGTEIDGEELRALSTYTYSYNYAGDVDIVLQIIKSGYEEGTFKYTLSDTDQSVKVSVEIDRNI